MLHDAIIVGGSYAGLSAALQLARARRLVMVIDGGQRRNRFAAASHGLLGQDGRAPGDIIADARAQLMAYPTVTWVDGTVERVARTGDGFAVCVEKRVSYDAKRLVLATGVADQLPDVPGLAERWGRSVFHCPYCHGYELGGGPVGVLAGSEFSMHHALMLPDWAPTTFFLNGTFEPDDEQLAHLAQRGVTVEHQPVVRISGEAATVELSDGRAVPLRGIFVLARTAPVSPLAEQLGCAMEDGPVGPYIRTDETRETTVPGVFACGDIARPAGSLALAVGDGTMAGVAVHRSLIFRPA